jgi:hypothetical protein
MKEVTFSRDLALTSPVSEKMEFVFRPLENLEITLIEGSLRNPGPPIPLAISQFAQAGSTLSLFVSDKF